MIARATLMLVMLFGLMAGGTLFAQPGPGSHGAHQAANTAPCPHHLAGTSDDSGCFHDGGCHCVHACSATIATVSLFAIALPTASGAAPLQLVAPPRAGMPTLPWRPPSA